MKAARAPDAVILAWADVLRSPPLPLDGPTLFALHHFAVNLFGYDAAPTPTARSIFKPALHTTDTGASTNAHHRVTAARRSETDYLLTTLGCRATVVPATAQSHATDSVVLAITRYVDSATGSLPERL
jgi:hypothetical protein